MPDFRKRSHQEELMDDLTISKEELHQTLQELDSINRWLGGYSVSLEGIEHLLPSNAKRVRILDVGTGGGEFLAKLHKRLKDKHIEPTLMGIDFNPHCIEYAKTHCDGLPIQFHAKDVRNALDEEYDVIHASLFFHHFQDEEMINLLRQMKECSRFGVVINDLQRHPFAYYSIYILTRLLSKNRLIRNDAPISVLRAFSRKELYHLFDKAGWVDVSIQWRWAFRWLLIASQRENHEPL